MTATTCINMIQRSKYRYDITTPKGFPLVEDLYFASPYKAEEYVAAYISTWTTWHYRMILQELV